MSLNWFDIGIVAVVLLSIVISFFRGFLRETISLITWVVGLFVAIRFAPTVSNWLSTIIAIEILRYVIAFVILFMLIFIVGLLANMTIKRGVDVSGLSVVDRLLGGIFGAARGILLVAVVLMFMTMSTFKNNAMAMTADSKLTPSFMPIVAWLDGFLPQELQRLTQWMKIDDDPLQHPQNAEQSQQQEP